LRLGIICIMSFFTILGFLRFEAVSLENPISSVTDKSLKNTSVIGRVYKKKYTGSEYQLFLENPLIINDENSICFKAKAIRVITSLPFDEKIGEMLPVKGTLSPLRPATNEGQFDAVSYYECRGIEGSLYAYENIDKGMLLEEVGDSALIYESAEAAGYLKALKEGERRTISDKLLELFYEGALAFREGLYSIFPKKEAGILNAMLTGERGGIEEDIRNLYSDVGIAHILSISGLHISLLGMGIFKILMFFFHRLRLSVALTIIFMLAYGSFTGFSVSTQRAVIMLICMLMAKILGRAYDGQSAGALAAMIILLKEPRFIKDTGFLLSFFAVFGIFSANEILRELRIEKRFLRYCIPGLSAQLAIFPILLSAYYSYSAYGIIVNMLLLPLMSTVIFSGFLAGIFGLLFNVLGYLFWNITGRLIGGAAYYILEFYEWFSGKILELPGSKMIVGKPEVWQIAVYYILYFIIIYLIVCRRCFKEKDIHLNKGAEKSADKMNVTEKRLSVNGLSAKKSLLIRNCLKISGFVVILILMFFSVIYRKTVSGIRIVFLDVGQGQCIFIDDGKQRILVDGGSSDRTNIGKNVIIPFLMSQGVSKIDISLVTHTDSDHTNGLKELIKDGDIAVKRMILGDNVSSGDNLVTLSNDAGIPTEFLYAGSKINDYIRLLSPEKGEFYPDDNSASLVALLDYGELQLLITGDSDSYAEEIYSSKENGTADIIQVPHHGSRYSSSRQLIERFSPKMAVVSCAKYNSYGHPAPEVTERYKARGCRVLSTADMGMISIYYDSSEADIEILTYK